MMPNAVLYLIPVVIWGTTWLAIKFQLGVVSPEFSIAYRFGMAAVLLLVYASLRGLNLRYRAAQHAAMAVQGLFLFCLNYLLVYLAEGHLSSGLVAILFSTVIIMNVLFGALLLKAPIRSQVLVGAVIGLAGLGLIFHVEISSFDLASGRAVGLLLAFAGATSASLGNILSSRNQSRGLPVVQTNAFGMAYGALIMLTFGLVRGAQLTFDPSFSYIASLLYLAVFGSIVAFTSYLVLLGRIGADRAAYVAVLFPIIALLLSTLFEGLRWGLPQLAGAALVLFGNAVVLTKAESLAAFSRRIGVAPRRE
jgi:drug/metabolite transporter (DMT)-like permease